MPDSSLVALAGPTWTPAPFWVDRSELAPVEAATLGSRSGRRRRCRRRARVRRLLRSERSGRQQRCGHGSSGHEHPLLAAGRCTGPGVAGSRIGGGSALPTTTRGRQRSLGPPATLRSRNRPGGDRLSWRASSAAATALPEGFQRGCPFDADLGALTRPGRSARRGSDRRPEARDHRCSVITSMAAPGLHRNRRGQFTPTPERLRRMDRRRHGASISTRPGTVGLIVADEAVEGRPRKAVQSGTSGSGPGSGARGCPSPGPDRRRRCRTRCLPGGAVGTQPHADPPSGSTRRRFRLPGRGRRGGDRRRLLGPGQLGPTDAFRSGAAHRGELRGAGDRTSFTDAVLLRGGRPRP